MKKKLITIILLIVFGVGFFVGWNEKAPISDKPAVKIGVILPLTGGLADIGSNAKEAVKMAIDAIDNKEIDIKIIFEDDMASPAKTAILTNKLINLDKVNALMSWSATAGNVVSPIADKHGIIHVGIATDKNIAKGDLNFLNFTSNESFAKEFIKVANRHNAKNIIMFVSTQAGMQQTADAVAEEIKNTDIRIKRVDFNNDTKDFNMVMDEAKTKGYDMWVVDSFPPSLDIFIKTFLIKGIDKPLTSIGSFNFSNEKGLLEELEYVDVPTGDANVLDEIESKTGSGNFFSIAYVYDTAKILGEAFNTLYIKNGKIPTSYEVAEFISGIKGYQGAAGEVNVDEIGAIRTKAVIKKMIDGKPVLVEEE